MGYGLNADNIRLEMIRETLSIENVNVLHKALEYIRQLKQQSASKPPCQYTIEELRAHVMEAVKAGRVYTNEEIIKMFPDTIHLASCRASGTFTEKFANESPIPDHRQTL